MCVRYPKSSKYDVVGGTGCPTPHAAHTSAVAGGAGGAPQRQHGVAAGEAERGTADEDSVRCVVDDGDAEFA